MAVTAVTCSLAEIKQLLFVCSRNKLRSATAETVCAAMPDIDAIGCGTNNDSPTPLSGDLIEWADIVFVMEHVHRNKLNQKYSTLLRHKQVVCLDIPDDYDYMQPELVTLLKTRLSQYL